MPTTYAHYKFGDEVIQNLPNNLKEIINKNRELFDIGAHGPDIFFYYDALKDNDVIRFGYDMHHIPANTFFKRCKEAYNGNHNKEAMLSYILGFLSHFAFDSTTHGYVERKKEVSMISHNHIESQYDRHLMVKDGLNPLKTNRADSIIPSKRSARVISYFFDFNEEIVFKTLKDMKLIVGVFLYTPFSIHRNGLYNFMKKTMPNNDFKDIIIKDYDDEACKDSNLRLDKLKNEAINLYPYLLNNLLNYFNDKEELNPYFQHDFNCWPDYQNIPILSYEKELNFHIEPIKI